MRSITFISMMALLAPTGAQADANLTQGCFARSYDAAHLAKNPDQVVASIALSFDYDPRSDFAPVPADGFGAALTVVLADQGHVARERAPDEGYPNGFGGAHMHTVLLCQPHGTVIGCVTPCDSGGFEVTRYDGKTLAFTTSYLAVGQGQDCGGFTDLAEGPNQTTTYVLHRVADATCTEN